MRIILSRKGFDSAAGGCPSPILPDGRLFPYLSQTKLRLLDTPISSSMALMWVSWLRN